MADIVLFGATGYTGKLTAAALHRKGADFAIAGRDPEKLKHLAAATGSPEIFVVDATDVDGLTTALGDARVLITCVGPFAELGETAVEAALRAGVHYIDSCGEAPFIGRLIEEYHERALAAGIVIAPALGFDEVPGDVVSTMAAEGLERPTITVTYAVPRTGSAGTIRSIPGVMASRGPFITQSKPRWVGAGQLQRWSPMPEPLGPKRAFSIPLSLLYLAPLHLDVSTFETYMTSGLSQGLALRFGTGALKAFQTAPGRKLLNRVTRSLPEGPNEQQRKAKWTILAEARSGDEWRNVSATGPDVYGLTAQTLSRAAIEMTAPSYSNSGVVAPVGSVGVEALRDELAGFGVTFDTYGPGGR